jgi:hypothetical protein
MNKDLVGFSVDIGEKTLKIPAIEKIFDRRILENVTRDEIGEVLRTEVFLDLENIIMRLGGKCDDEDTAINLLQIVEFFAIDYLMMIRKRLRNLGVTKYSLYTLFKAIVDNKEYHDTISIVEKLSEDERFLVLWGKIEFLVSDFDFLLQILNLNMTMLMVDEADLIPDVDDDIPYSDMIIKFDNFKNK